MKVGNYEVKNVTRESAEVGCTKVTKTEVEAVLAAMNSAPIVQPVLYRIEYESGGTWVSCRSVLLGSTYFLGQALKAIEEGLLIWPYMKFRVVPV